MLEVGFSSNTLVINMRVMRVGVAPIQLSKTGVSIVVGICIVTAVTASVKDQICWAALDIGCSITTVVKAMFVIRVGVQPIYLSITGVYRGGGCGNVTAFTEMPKDIITWAFFKCASSIKTVVIIAWVIRVEVEPIFLSSTEVGKTWNQERMQVSDEGVDAMMTEMSTEVIQVQR